MREEKTKALQERLANEEREKRATRRRAAEQQRCDSLLTVTLTTAHSCNVGEPKKQLCCWLPDNKKSGVLLFVPTATGSQNDKPKNELLQRSSAW